MLKIILAILVGCGAFWLLSHFTLSVNTLKIILSAGAGLALLIKD